jgi:hypothetical protein
MGRLRDRMVEHPHDRLFAVGAELLYLGEFVGHQMPNGLKLDCCHGGATLRAFR